MVKPDCKRDYYADLDLPNTADQETIKKRFRDLARQYHPDRNRGRELEVTEKFQVIQAAHEILNNPDQKTKYDEDRAKLKAREADAGLFRKPAPPKRTETGFSNGGYTSGNAGRREPSATRYAPQSAPRSRPASAASTGADKFAQFARAAPQQWDRTRQEEAARADGLRGLNFMRGGHMPQTSPPRTRPPTAPRQNGGYSPTTEPSPGFPGLNRSTSRREWSSHGTPSDDNGPKSAYAYVNRDRPSSSTYQDTRYRDPEPSLRENKSLQPGDFSHLRPGLGRTPSRYARTGGGERTEINTGNLSRTTSVKGSPSGTPWEDREKGAFGNHAGAEAQSPRPRHRSHSPRSRKVEPQFQYASQSTSSDDDDLPPPGQRKKATLRRPQTHSSGMGSGMDGYFPSDNYTKIVDDSSTYDFPAPQNKGPPTRKPFPNMASPVDSRDQSGNETSHRMSSQEGIPTNRSYESSTDDQQEQNRFSAEEWHDQLNNHTDLFNPPDTFTSDRKSPSKNLRSSRSGPGRSGGHRDLRKEGNADESTTMPPGFRHVAGNGTRNNSETAFRPPKLNADFVDKATTRNRSSTTPTSPSYRSAEEAKYPNIPSVVRERATPDEMDVDSPAAPDTDSGSSVHVTVEEEHSNTSVSATPSPRQTHHRRSDQNRVSDHHRDGFDLEDLKKSAPFAPTNGGLKDLDDLTNSLPFQSRPAETLEALHRTPSHRLRELNLPRSPDVPRCPADDNVTRETWTQYIKEMNVYMHGWEKFNAAMIEHFAIRQRATTHHMWRNWMESVDDGPSAEDFEADEVKNVGYAAYLTWIDDDRRCRTWWDVACEKHRAAIEELGRIRSRVKELRRAHAR